MVFDVEITRERGWILPRFRSCMLQPIRANVVVREERDELLSRTLMVARLLSSGSNEIENAPVLFDARLACMRGDCQVLIGLEREHDLLQDRTFEYAQSWILRPVP